jgi:hypothetical protein
LSWYSAYTRELALIHGQPFYKSGNVLQQTFTWQNYKQFCTAIAT